MAPQPLVPALGQQVQVQRPERRPEPVRIIDRHHGAIGIGRLQTVVRDIRPLQRPGEQPRRVHAAHLDPLLACQDDHAGRVRAPPADHHPVAAIAVPLRMSTQQVVRIVMLASDQTLNVRAIGHQAEFNR